MGTVCRKLPGEALKNKMGTWDLPCPSSPALGPLDSGEEWSSSEADLGCSSRLGAG